MGRRGDASRRGATREGERAGTRNTLAPAMLSAVPFLLCSLLARAGHAALCDPDYLDALTRAEERHRAFDYDAAIAAYRSALLRDPSGFHALRGLADSWNDRGEGLGGMAAEDAFARALGYAQCLEEAFPSLPEGPAWVAASYGNLTTAASAGDRVAFSREIAAAARRALGHDPDFASALVALGIYERELSTLGFFARTAVRTMFGGLPEAEPRRVGAAAPAGGGGGAREPARPLRAGADVARGTKAGGGGLCPGSGAGTPAFGIQGRLHASSMRRPASPA